MAIGRIGDVNRFKDARFYRGVLNLNAGYSISNKIDRRIDYIKGFKIMGLSDHFAKPQRIDDMISTLRPQHYKITSVSGAAIFPLAGVFRKNPLLENVLMNCVSRNPKLALKHFDKYKDQPYAERVLSEAAEIKPRLAIYHFRSYEDQPYAAKMLAISVFRLPSAMLKKYLRF